MAESTLHLHDEDLAANVCWRLLLEGSDRAKIDAVESPCFGCYDVKYRYWSDSVKDEVREMIEEWNVDAASGMDCLSEDPSIDSAKRGNRQRISRNDILAVQAICAVLDAKFDLDVNEASYKRIFDIGSILIDYLQDEGLANVTLEWIEMALENVGDAE